VRSVLPEWRARPEEHKDNTGAAAGRQTAYDITVFDSTGLAIQDLAIALGALEALRAGAVRPQTVSL